MNKISQLLASAGAAATLTLTGCAEQPVVNTETNKAIEVMNRSSGTETKDGCIIVKAGSKDSNGAEIPPQMICPER